MKKLQASLSWKTKYFWSMAIFAMLFVLALCPMQAKASSEELTPEVLRERLEALEVQFPAGKYWNHVGSNENNAEGTTDTPCNRHVNISNTCNVVVVNGRTTSQCWGFANLLSQKLYGSYFQDWHSDRNVENIRPGDVLQYGYANSVVGHTVLVLSVCGDDVTVVDCNYDKHCVIRWRAVISRKMIDQNVNTGNFATYSTNGVYHAPAVLPVKAGYCGENATYLLDENGTLTIQGTGAVYDRFFEGREDIEKILIEDGITMIGLRTFADCTQLKEIIFADSVETFYGKCFYGCNALKKCNVPAGLKYLGNEVFRGCAVETFDLPKDMEMIGTNVFYGCPGFAGNTSHYELRDGILCISGSGDIYSGLFQKQADVREVVIEKGIQGLGAGAFEECSALQKVTLPEGLKKIGETCFRTCGSLTQVNLPDSLTEIGKRAFGSCALEPVELPDSLEKEGDYIFERCPGFCGNRSRYVIENRVLKISGSGAIYEDAFYRKTNFDQAYIEEGITEIGEWAFAQTPLRYMEIPRSMRKIDDSAFAYCTSLSQVDCYASALTLDWTTPEYSSFITNPEKGTVFNVPADQLEYYVGMFGDVQNVTFAGELPGNEEPVRTVLKGQCGIGAYYELKSDGTLILEGLGNLYSNAFDARKNATWKAIKNVIVGEGILCLGYEMFYGCNMLQTIKLSSTVGYFDPDVILECTALTDVYCYADPLYFRYCDGFATDGLKIHVRAEDLEAWQNHEDVPASTILIGDLEPSETVFDPSCGRCGIDAYYQMDETNTLHVTGSGRISESFFSRNWNGNWSSVLQKDQYKLSFQNVQKVIIDEGITEIGAKGFQSLTSVTEVVLPESLKVIGNEAFWGCEKLNGIVFPHGLQRIGAGSFIGCTAVNEFTSLANPDALTWPKYNSGLITDDFKRDGTKTICHVPSNYAKKYQDKFAEINVMFVGDLAPELQGLTFEAVEEKAASCSEPGSIAYFRGSDGQFYVSEAGVLLEDQNGDGVVNKRDIVIPALGHVHTEDSLSWRWEKASEDFAVTACLKCMRCGAFEESVPAEVVKTEGENSVTYVATATIGDTEVSMTREIKNEYYVTIDGASSMHAFGDCLKAYAAQPSEGMAFAGWYEGETLVCNSTELDFLVSRNVSLHTVYVKAEEYVEPTEPILNFDLSERVFDENGNQKLDMTVTWYLSEGMSVKDVGLVRTTDGEAELTIDNEDVKKRSAGIDTESGTYIHHLTLGSVSSALTAYAKAYLVYDDAQGEEHVLYTETATSAPMTMSETTNNRAAAPQEEEEDANGGEKANNGEETNNAEEAGEESDNEENAAEQGEQ